MTARRPRWLPSRRLPSRWLPVLVGLWLAGVFFGIEHLPDASARPDYAPDEETMLDAQTKGDPLRRICLLGLAVGGAAGLAAGSAGRLREGGPLGAVLVLYFGWMFASVVWSAVPGVTLRRVVVLGLYLLAAAGVCRALTGRGLVWAAVTAVGAHLLVGLGAEAVLGTLTPWRGEYRFAGTIHPNMQALQLGVGVLGAATLILRPGVFARPGGRAGPGRPYSRGPATPWTWAAWRLPMLLGVAGVFLGFAVLTKSRTSVLGLGAAVCGLALFRLGGPSKLLVALGGAACATAGLVAILLTGLDPAGDVRRAALMGRGEQSSTFSGRLEIWEALDPFVADRPLLGYGYGAFWDEERTYAVQADAGFKFASAHSAWYETLLTGGVVAAVLFAAVFAVGLWTAGRAERRTKAAAGRGEPVPPGAVGGDPLPPFVFGVLVLCLLNTLLEAIVADIRLTSLVMLCGLLKLSVLPDRPAPRPADRPADRPAGGGA